MCITQSSMNKFFVNHRTQEFVECVCCGTAYLKAGLEEAGWDAVYDTAERQRIHDLGRQGVYKHARHQDVLEYHDHAVPAYA